MTKWPIPFLKRTISVKSGRKGEGKGIGGGTEITIVETFHETSLQTDMYVTFCRDAKFCVSTGGVFYPLICLHTYGVRIRRGMPLRYHGPHTYGVRVKCNRPDSTAAG